MTRSSAMVSQALGSYQAWLFVRLAGNWAQNFKINCVAFSSGCPSGANYCWTHNGSLMAHHTHEQLAEMKNEQKLKTCVKNKVTIFWCIAQMCQRRFFFFFFFFAGYNLAVIAVQMTGCVPNIKEWISSIYTLQVYNHGLHVVAKLLSCNLALRRISWSGSP